MSDLSQFSWDQGGLPPLPDSVQDQVLPSPEMPMGLPQAGGVPVDGIPLFELVAMKMADGSYQNVEYVNILTPGDPKQSPRHKVNDTIRAKYPMYYERWKRGLQSAPVGTPLEMFPVLTPAQVHTMKANNIFTVEHLAAVSDANLVAIPMGIEMRAKARQWLETKAKTDDMERDEAEKQAMREAMNEQAKELADLKAQMKALQMPRAEAAAAVAAASDGATPHPEAKSGRPTLHLKNK